MTAAVPAPAPAPELAQVANRRRLWLLAAACGVVAFAARFLLLRSGGGLFGIGLYDDGVYFSAANSLVHGRMLYRDFLLLHPPGLMLALTPFAAVASVIGDANAFALARLAFLLIGVANTVIVVFVLRRFGLVAAATGGLFYALFARSAYSEQTIALETLGTTGILLALLVLDSDAARRASGARGFLWLALGGAFLGVAIGQKIWFVAPAIVILLFHLRRALPIVVGAAVTTTGVYLPFFLVAPGTMWREVVQDQLGRPAYATPRILFRLAVALGGPMPTESTTSTVGDAVTIVLLLATVAVLTVAARTRGARVYVVLFLVGLAVLFTSPVLFWHYGSLTAPPLALATGVAVGRVASRIRARHWRIALVAAVALATALLTVVDARTAHGGIGVGKRAPVAALQAAGKRIGGCIIADDPTVLIIMNVESRQLRAGCPLWPDVTGWTYDADRLRVDGRDVPRIRNPLWQARALRYLSSGTSVILIRPNGTRLDAAGVAALTRGPVLFRSGAFTIHRTVNRAG